MNTLIDGIIRVVFVCFITVFSGMFACSNGGSNGPDVTPNSFSFAPETDADFAEPYEASATITGIDGSVRVSISGDGEYKIGVNGTYTTTAGSVSNGGTIFVRVNASSKAETITQAALTVGSMTRTFAVTSGPDTTAPEVSILFPPPVSMTEGDNVFVRGTVVDVHGFLELVTIAIGDGAPIVLNVEEDGSWQVPADLDLQEGENTITVVAEDVAGNVNDSTTVMVKKDVLTAAFPDEEAQFVNVHTTEIKEEDGELIAYVMNFDNSPVEDQSVYTVNLSTGKRTRLIDNSAQPELPIIHPGDIEAMFDNRLFLMDYFDGLIFEIDATTGMRRVIDSVANNSFAEGQEVIQGAIFNGQERLYVMDNLNFYWLDLETYEATLLSGADVPDSENPFQSGSKSGLSIEIDRNRALMGSVSDLYIIDLETGAREILPRFDIMGQTPEFYGMSRLGLSDKYILNVNNSEFYSWEDGAADLTLLSNASMPDEHNVIGEAWDVSHFPGHGYVIVSDRRNNGLIAIDLVSGKRVIISKSDTSAE